MSDGGRGKAPAVETTSSEVPLPPYRFWETRSGAGTPVVLIHGLGGSADWWRRNFDALVAEHLVVAIDLVGFGRNRLFAKRTSLPLAFADIAALLARWIGSSFDGPVHLVGNSMGGQIAIHIAARRPDLVRSLTLVNSSGIPFEIAPMQHLENLIVPPGALSFATILARDAFRSGATSIAVAFARLLRDDARPLIRSISVPTLILWGERDPLVPLSYARQLEQMIAGARLVTIPNAGHIPMWENPAVFNRELLEFLRDVEKLPVAGARLPTFHWSIAGVANHIAYREAGTRRDIVLIHGLGMSGVYLERFALSLFDRGMHAIAPDLLEFDVEPVIGWADALEARDAVWIGHSLGCNLVANVARQRPDLVRNAIYVGPLWTHARHPVLRLAGALMLDAFREPLSLYRDVFAAYWNRGLWPLWRTFRRALPEIRQPAPAGLLIAGERDPLPDPSIGEIRRVPGAHACLYSDADASADFVVTSSRPPSSSAPP